MLKSTEINFWDQQKTDGHITRFVLRHSSSAGFLSSLFSVAHCLAPAPLKLRPYGAIQMRLLLLLLLFYTPGSIDP